MAKITHLTYRPDLGAFEVRRQGNLVNDRQFFTLTDADGRAPLDVAEYLGKALAAYQGETRLGSMTPIKGDT